MSKRRNSGPELVANAPRRGELASSWVRRQVEFMEHRIPPRLSTDAQALAYISGMRQTLADLEYYEDFNVRRQIGEVESCEDLAA
jgi:hypothetical protein